MPRSSSSSSDDEDESKLAQLRESVVTLDNLKSEAAKREEVKAATSSKLAAKTTNRTNNENDPFQLDVSPEFQEFVAKKLAKKLDELISWTSVEQKRESNKKSDNDDFKLEILRNVYVDLTLETSESNETDNQTQNDLKENRKKHHNHDKKSKKKKSSHSKESSNSDESDDEDNERFKEAAIDVDFLIKTSCIEQHKESLTSFKQQQTNKS